MSEEGAISSKKHYFWGYDIFGYLLPGAVVALIAAKTNELIYNELSGHWHIEEATFGIHAIDFIVLLLFVYILGHIISGISSFFLERLILRNTLRYPTDRMFTKDAEKVGVFWRFIFTGYFRPYSLNFQNSILEKFQNKYPQLKENTH